MLLSICIPTFNRRERLDDCLNSILIAKKKSKIKFEICISDNKSNYNIASLIKKYDKELSISLNINKKNLGFAINAINCVHMASGRYSWLIGDDDLLTPDSLFYLYELLNNNLDKDYFYINSYNLNVNELNNLQKPLNTEHIDLKKLKTISNFKENKSVLFWDIINPKVSWDFLIGIFLSVFRTNKWVEKSAVLDKKKIEDTRVWSTFENTCLHPILLAEAFNNSKAFICAKPLSINLQGVREWGDLYEFIEIVRIPQLLDYYKSKGLKLTKYIYYKNFSLRNFCNYFFKIFVGGKKKGWHYVDIKKDILFNILYPNVFLSFFVFFIRKINNLIKKK